MAGNTLDSVGPKIFRTTDGRQWEVILEDADPNQQELDELKEDCFGKKDDTGGSNEPLPKMPWNR